MDEHFTGPLAEGEGVAARVLKSLEVDIERTRNEISKSSIQILHRPNQTGKAEADKKDVKTRPFPRFNRDLTDLAKKELDPVIGRRNELSASFKALPKNKNNRC